MVTAATTSPRTVRVAPDRATGHGRNVRPAGPAEGISVLYGWHPVLQALANDGRHLHRLLATENAVARL